MIQTNSGIGICGLLFVAFVILKVIGMLTWSWWWIACPIWIGLGITCLFLIILGIIIGITVLVDWLRKPKKKVINKNYTYSIEGDTEDPFVWKSD